MDIHNLLVKLPSCQLGPVLWRTFYDTERSGLLGRWLIVSKSVDFATGHPILEILSMCVRVSLSGTAVIDTTVRN